MQNHINLDNRIQMLNQLRLMAQYEVSVTYGLHLGDLYRVHEVNTSIEISILKVCSNLTESMFEA